MSILRQLKDIQVQANKLDAENSDIEDFRSFAKYNDELKSFLLANEPDAFTLNLINEIPDLEIDALTGKSNVLFMLVGFITHIFGTSIIKQHF